MKLAFWSRRLHKWLGLLVGIQALLWMASGVYMTAVSIDFIHGDHLSHVERPPLDAGRVAVQPAQLAAQFPSMTSFRLKRLQERDVYEVKHPAGVSLVDAGTGQRLDPLDETGARSLALEAYQGEGNLKEIRLLHQLPQEVASRKGPLWRADFDDEFGSALYISPSTGEVVAKRHTMWRVFDFLWMLHIMDYDTRSDVNNSLLRAASAAGVLFALSGLWLLWFTVRRRTAS
ncbi:PepSY domain-containing protein [Pseudoduganella sp. UC29_106]|uniref:PepSY domain-containing protein n=1 Tax=Pseudoduganella sp. UC29_106 TaxID=3374553 RepID=UPI00375795B6